MEQKLIDIDNALKTTLAERKTQYKGLIHHYTSPDGLKGILTDKEIWFSNTKFLNDSSENNYIYSLFPRYYDTYKECLLERNFFDTINSIAEQYLSRDFCCIDGNRLWAENIFVASFSKDDDNLTLWNYYAKNPECLGYNITFYNQPFDMNPPYFKYIYGEVIYSENEQKNLLKNIIIKYNEVYSNNKDIIENDKNIKDNFIFHFINIIELYNIFFKHPKYENEKEYRWALYNICNYAGLGPHYRIHKGIFIPYIKIPFEKDMVIQVGVGPSGNKDLLRKSVDLFINSAGFPHIHSWASKIPLRY